MIFQFCDFDEVVVNTVGAKEKKSWCHPRRPPLVGAARPDGRRSFPDLRLDFELMPGG